MRRRRSPAPPWFLVLVAVASALALRLLVQAYGVGDAAPGHPPPPSVAFFAFLIALGELIWKGISVAGRVTLEVLKWTVVNLSLVVTKLKNGLAALGGDLLKALKRSWDFTRKLYDDVLKPAWTKFWKWFDTFRRWLDDTFGPVIAWLQDLRDNLLAFYRTYVRPWLDMIDVTRKLLRVLAALHIPFARELDRRLGRLEELIEKPIRLLLAKLNEVITLVDRVITFDGLIQRLALVRSLARDYKYAWNLIESAYSKPLTSSDKEQLQEANAPKTRAQIDAQAVAYLTTGTGPKAALFEELAQSLETYAKAR